MKGEKSDRLFDKRVVRRNIRAGRVSTDEYDSFLGDLPDLTDAVKAKEDGGDDDGFDGTPPAPEPAPAEDLDAVDAPAPAHDEPPAAYGFGSPDPGPPAPPAPPVPPVSSAPPVPAPAPADPYGAPPAARPPLVPPAPDPDPDQS